MRRRRVDLSQRIDLLTEAVNLSEGIVPDDVAARARAVVTRADQRCRIGGDHTVVALAGATGSGKSSTFNALAGAQLADPGVRRPTTSKATAAVWGTQSAQTLLDWLDVPRRHHMGSEDPLDGLVLLDLPDHDSVRTEHRLEVDRLVEMVDMIVWVVDPQKYADAALHTRYLAPLARHAEVMTVVLNQVDRLDEEQRKSCLRDLRRLLDSEGLDKAKIMAMSARTGEGVENMRAVLAHTVRAKKAQAARLHADLDDVLQYLSEATGDVAGHVSHDCVDHLIEVLCLAGGVEPVVEATRDAYRRRGHRATGWPVTAWMSRLRPDPLHRLHLDVTSQRKKALKSGIEPTDVQRSALTARVGVAEAKVDTAVRSLALDAAEGLPRSWADAVRAASLSHRKDLPDDIDRAVVSTDLGVHRGTGWWKLVTVVQWVLVIVVVAGLAWLAADAVSAYMQVRLPPVRWHHFPVPTLMVAGGIVAGIMVSMLCQVGVQVGARAAARYARSELRANLADVAWQSVVDPVNAELDHHDEVVRLLAKAS
ncbi:ABC transporter [Cutibacterium sp. WCA-380-WT-3A]|uniref:ABC transporter n=1 Tax=Cutibacterium porci TaxID=2605781 RepID=A0A7K0J9Q3_9ACTN|nr:YfjP family GTPase [Cutibacterium porci]MSS46600.1 ABC transporter [Cutibacterium porci]